MHTLTLSTLSAALLLAPVGCAKNYAAPTFDAVGVQESVQTDGLSILTFDIEATNPNREPMALGQATYTLSLDGTDVFTGVRSPESTLHTFSSHTFSLPAVIPADLISSTGEIPYRLRGTVIYKNPGALADVLFDAEVIVPEATLDLDGTINLGQ